MVVRKSRERGAQIRIGEHQRQRGGAADIVRPIFEHIDAVALVTSVTPCAFYGLAELLEFSVSGIFQGVHLLVDIPFLDNEVRAVAVEIEELEHVEREADKLEIVVVGVCYLIVDHLLEGRVEEMEPCEGGGDRCAEFVQQVAVDVRALGNAGDVHGLFLEAVDDIRLLFDC